MTSGDYESVTPLRRTARINSRSNSASPPSTVSIKRPCAVVVSAQVSLLFGVQFWALVQIAEAGHARGKLARRWS